MFSISNRILAERTCLVTGQDSLISAPYILNSFIPCTDNYVFGAVARAQLAREHHAMNCFALHLWPAWR